MRFLVLAALVMGACNNGGDKVRVPGAFEPSGEKLLTVDGKFDVTTDMVAAVTRFTTDAEIENQKQSGGYVKMVEQIALGELLYRQALEAGLDKDPEIIKSLRMKEREALAQEMLAKRVRERVTDAAIQAAYDERAVQYRQPQARARHILVQEQALAEEIMEKLGRGEDFAKLAEEFTIDARTRGEGGNLGWFQRDKLIEEVAAAAFDSPLNKPVGPIETRFGFHVLEPLERRDAIPLEEVHDQIEAELLEKEYGKVIEEVKASLRFERFGELQEIHNRTDAWGVTKGTPPPGEH